MKQTKRDEIPELDWHATCDECGCKKMSYYNFKYMCPKCGYVLEV